jgi:hypothetical protein
VRLLSLPRCLPSTARRTQNIVGHESSACGRVRPGVVSDLLDQTFFPDADPLRAAATRAPQPDQGNGRPGRTTGKRTRFSGVNTFRMRDGKVAEIWNHRDDLGLMQQVGIPIYAGAAPDR